MANYYPEVVDVIISDATRPTEKEGFEIPVFFTPTMHKPISFTRPREVIEAGFAINSPVERFVANTFAGEFAPSIVKVFPMEIGTIAVTVDNTIKANDVVTLNFAKPTVNKVIEQQYVTGINETVAALKATLDSETGKTWEISSNTLTYTYAGGDADFSVGFGDFASVEYTTTVQPATAYAAALEFDDNFFYSASSLHDAESVEAFGLAAAAEKKAHIYSTSELKCGQPDQSYSIAQTLADKSIDYVAGMFHEEAETQFPEGAIIGYNAKIQPQNKNTLNMATLVGITPSKLSSQFKQTLAKRNMSYYVKEQGVGVLHEGWVASGKFFDLIRFKCWAAARTKESIFNHLKRASDTGTAVIFDQQDFDALALSIRSEMINPAITGGTVLNTTSINTVTGKTIDLRPTITFPARADIPTSTLADRVLENVYVELVYGNPIHHVKININVVLNRQ